MIKKVKKIAVSVMAIGMLSGLAINTANETQKVYANNDITWTANMSCTANGTNRCHRGRAWTVGRVGAHMGDTNISASAHWLYLDSMGAYSVVLATATNSSSLGSVTADTGYSTQTRRITGMHSNSGRAWRG